MKINRRQIRHLLIEALGDRGDLPKKYQYKIGMRGPEDLPESPPGESFLDTPDSQYTHDDYAEEVDPERIAFIDIPDKDPLFMSIADDMGVTVQHIGTNAYVVDTYARVLAFTMRCLHEEMGGAVSVSEADAMEYISLGRPDLNENKTKLNRIQLRSLITDITEATFYRHKPRDPEDVIPEPDRFDHARTPEEAFEEARRYISTAIAKRLESRGTRRGVSPADLKLMSFALLREIIAEAGEYTGLSLDDFLKKISEGDLDKKINAMRRSS